MVNNEMIFVQVPTLMFYQRPVGNNKSASGELRESDITVKNLFLFMTINVNHNYNPNLDLS